MGDAPTPPPGEYPSPPGAASGTATALLEVEGLRKAFGGLQALDGVDLTVGEREIVGLIGPNGSGKTTFFNVLTGYYRPDGGSVRLGGVPITGCRPVEACRRGIARTFQLVRPFAQMTARENVLVGRAYGAAPAPVLAQGVAEAEALLEFVGLAGRADTRAGSLTLVDRKRLELARALAARPRLLLLDEMMAGLNPTETAGAMDLISRIRGQGISVIMVEHIMQAVLGISDRVAVLNVGRKIADGPPADVIADPQVVEAYLGRGDYLSDE